MTDIAIMDTPQVIFEELISELTRDAAGSDRNLQTRIGPSGMGTECNVWLLHMLAETPEPAGKVKWQAHVGTAMHAQFERIMRNSIGNTAGTTPRYLIESTVNVGNITGIGPITGHVDLFDTLSGYVIDWKTVSKSQATKYERNIRLGRGIGQQYRAQLHLYGLGMMMAGHTVKHVMDVFVPRDMDLDPAAPGWPGEVERGHIPSAFYFSEPFDPQIAFAALERCNELMAAINDPSVGLYGAIDKYRAAECPDYFCPWCERKAREPADLPDVSSANPFGLAAK